MLAICNFLLPCLAGDRSLDRHIRLYDGLFSDFILWCLAQLDNCPYRIFLVLIARCLSAPRRATHHGRSFVRYIYHRVIIIEQSGALDIFEPQSGMRTLARSALAEEEISLSLLYYGRRMKQECISGSRTHGIEQHQRGVNGCLEGSESRLLAEGASRNQKTGMLIIMTCNQYRFHISHCHQERLLLLSQTTADNELSLLILSAFLLETGRFPQFFPAFVQGKREGGQGSRCDLFIAFKRLISLQ